MFLHLFLNNWFIFLIPAVIAQIFNPTVELAMNLGISTKEAKVETEIHPVTAEIFIKSKPFFSNGPKILRRNPPDYTILLIILLIII